ncbi:MAG: hypothetical protein K0R16_2268 [Nitrososphaeraceae archaeon]|jgi:hypothetical protein|nr:hypothetical protein [Nitrososphaeraceae archaeon]MDF2768727.1 hypothetical protein [Nitrososphaeraceae archaeon]
MYVIKKKFMLLGIKGEKMHYIAMDFAKNIGYLRIALEIQFI